MNLDTTQLIALAAALGWASGIRLYAVVFITGLVGHLGWVPLPAGLQILQTPLVLGASGVMLLLEFAADKIPIVDSIWDAVHTVIRIPAGAALAAGAVGATGGDQASWALIAALAGGTLAATAQATKSTTRAAVNTSPEPFSNVAVSLLEDGLVVGALWLAYEHPLWFFAALALVLLISIVLIVVLFRFLRALIRRWRTRASGPALPQGRS
jgi:hypothetical protein